MREPLISDEYPMQRAKCYRIVIGHPHRKGYSVRSLQMRKDALELWDAERLSRRDHSKVEALAVRYGVTPQAVYKTLWQFDRTKK
jgi:hypothetical protein